MIEPLKFAYSDEQAWFGAAGNLLIHVYSGKVTQKHIERVIEQTRQVAAAHGGVFYSLSYIYTDVMPSMTPEARAYVRSQVATQDISPKATAQVVHGQGLGAATTRAILSGLNLFSKFRTRVFADLEPAADWLAGLGELEASRIVSLTHDARNRYAAERASQRSKASKE
jgi:drug/metabolite transporter superfamily protein YnfA